MKRHHAWNQLGYLPRLGVMKLLELFTSGETEAMWAESARTLNRRGTRYGPKVVSSRGAPYTGGMLPWAYPGDRKFEERFANEEALREQLRQKMLAAEPNPEMEFYTEQELLERRNSKGR